MILVLDANILVHTPLSRPSWRLLKARAGKWEIEILIPRVSVVEAVGKKFRSLDTLREGLKEVDKKGESCEIQAAVAVLGRRLEELEERFEADAFSVGAKIIDPVSVDPLEVVRRQVARRKPCKETTGDGYRDTLNWLTVLDLAERHPDQEIVWMSLDGDFGKERLHSQLVQEAEERGLADRITLERHFPSFVDRRKAADDELPDDEKAAVDHVVREAIQEFVRDTLLPGEFEKLLSGMVFPDLKEVEIGERTATGNDGGGVWSFSTSVQTSIGTPVPVRGLVTVDRLDQPLEGEVTIPLPEGMKDTFDEIAKNLQLLSDVQGGALRASARVMQEAFSRISGDFAGLFDVESLARAMKPLAEASAVVGQAGLPRASQPLAGLRPPEGLSGLDARHRTDGQEQPGQ